MHQVKRLCEAMGGLEGKRVLILGLGFRPEVKEHFCSPAFLLRDASLAEKAEPAVCDPLYTRAEIEEAGFVVGDPEAGDHFDAWMLNTAHDAFLRPDFSDAKSRGVEAVVDGRNAWSQVRVETAGITYLAVGRPGR